jgi:glycosyltransferase involved in cell wall biosynthesis
MSDVIEVNAAARHAARPPKLKIAFVADQFSPPVFDGSTFVYRNWIDFLGDTFELYAIFFSSYGGDASEAARYLAERSKAHIILPGMSRSRLLKVLRATSRLISGNVFAPRWIEQLGRNAIYRTIGDFIARHDLRLFLISKLASVPLFGETNLRRPGAVFFLDAHDDFVLREEKDREVLADLLGRFPQLKGYSRFRDMHLRQRLSRLVLRRARAQEARLCALFDCVLTSSLGEQAFYQTSLAGIVPCVHLGWPPRQAAAFGSGPASLAARPPFDAGFIGGANPFNVEGILFFCSEVLPLIRKHRPDFKVLIAGLIAAPLACIGCSWPGVEVCGYLPDARSFYERICVTVVPLLSGTGVSIKTLEALDSGKPVVSTRVGARGLEEWTAHGRLFLADEVEDFARKVLMLCTIGADDHGYPASAPQSAAISVSAFGSAFEKLLRDYGQARAPDEALALKRDSRRHIGAEQSARSRPDPAARRPSRYP